MKKKVVSVLLCVAMVATMAVGCGKKEEATEKKEDTKASSDLSVEIVAKGFQHDFWKAVKLGAEKAGKEMGATINFVGPKNESAIDEQVEQLNNAINKKPSAICLAALDPESIKGALADADAAKIPVVGFDSGVPGAKTIVANAATDSYAAGEMAADEMYKVIKDKVTD
ncbi:MAG: substrate-binding domain-containing protein, partial [Lachnospiraceae bacterium]